MCTKWSKIDVRCTFVCSQACGGAMGRLNAVRDSAGLNPEGFWSAYEYRRHRVPLAQGQGFASRMDDASGACRDLSHASPVRLVGPTTGGRLCAYSRGTALPFCTGRLRVG